MCPPRGSRCSCSSWCRRAVSHGKVLPGVLFAGKPLSADETRERLRVNVRPAVNVQTAALRELFTARVTRERLVAGVSSFMRRQVAAR